MALSFGAGLSPVWPGTAGSVVGFLLFWSLSELPPAARSLAYLVLFVLGAWTCHAAGYGLGKQDHRAIVWDETLGLSLTLEFLPPSAMWWAAGFILFRLIDATKPWPVRLVHDAPPNGFMVMLDDVLAAAYAAVVLFAVERAIGVIWS
jgi:phosphatidylglycerophosphatase A